MIKDCISYNGEADILEIRLNVLDKVVDEFVIVEMKETFSKLSKPLYFKQQKERFAKFLPKIKYYVNENTEEDRKLAASSPNTGGNPFWQEVFMMYESIKKPLIGSHDDDIIFISDCDEIWNPEIEFFNHRISRLEQLVYIGYLNNRSSEPWMGTVITDYKTLKDNALNHIKAPSTQNGITADIIKDGGWHFTYQGGKNELRRKLISTDTKHSHYGIPIETIEEKIEKNEDFFGRGFTYWVDESQWPEYLKENREKYKHLLNGINLLSKK